VDFESNSARPSYDSRVQRALATALTALVLPIGWPHHVALGLSDAPGDAGAVRREARFDARYQYLAGGVNTGSGWATWNPDGSFVTRYVRESRAAGMIPVLTYYQLLQSRPALGSSEAARDMSNLRDAATMQAYWRDFALLLRRARDAAGGRLVVVHVEPDLWGYLEQAGQVALARRFAHRVVALRNRIAARIALALHLSVWGTGEDPTYSKPSLAHMDALAARSARFYRALHTRFDLVFNDVTDRDAGFYATIEGNPRTAWGPEDFARHTRYIRRFSNMTGEPVVLWQLPLGNSGLDNTWGRFRDNRVQWWLGDRAHIRAERAAGIVGLLFGGGAAGTTSPQTDGGLFFRLARRYLARPVPISVRPPGRRPARRSPPLRR
jgi:hypothetical protein